MLAALHETIVTMFRHRPELAAEVLGRVWRVRVPRGAGRVLEWEEAPGHTAEQGADLVVAYGDGADAAAVIVEVQLRRNENKPYVWPLYQAALRARLRVPVCVLVVTVDHAVALWAGTPVATGQPGVRFAPVVLGPAAMPWLTAAEAARAPELAVLAVLAHHDDEGCPEVAGAALAATAAVDGRLAWLYHDAVAAHLGALARARLEELMTGDTFQQPLSEFGQRWFGEGQAAGAARGRLEGQAAALVAVLAARGLAPTEVQRVIIAACRDAATLDRWLRRAVSASSVDDALA